MPILVSYARVNLRPNEVATGPVTTQDFQEFLFRNTGSALDLYFCIKKDEKGWSWSGGMDVPTLYVEQIGKQIDRELVVR